MENFFVRITITQKYKKASTFMWKFIFYLEKKAFCIYNNNIFVEGYKIIKNINYIFIIKQMLKQYKRKIKEKETMHKNSKK